MAGQRNLGNTFIVDGLSANDDAADLAGTYFSEEVVREFEVVTSGGGAEFGRASSGTISVVTQSGTNRAAGRAYGFFRNDALDAANPLATRKDPLKQNQYGFTLRRSDREGSHVLVRQHRADAAGSHRHRHDCAGRRRPRSTRRSMRSAIAARGSRRATIATGYTTNNVFGRVDHQAARRAHLEVRYSLYDVTSAERPQRRRPERREPRRRARRHRSDASPRTILSALASGTINEARAQYTRSRLGAPVNDVDRPGGEHLRRRELRHGDVVADRARPRRGAGGRYADAAARSSPRQGGRRSAVQPRRRSRFPARCRAATRSRRCRISSAASIRSFSRRSASRR